MTPDTRYCRDCRQWEAIDFEHLPTLFDPPPRPTLARATDPETSHAAAKALGSHAGTMLRNLLVAYRSGDYTAEEAATAAGYGPGDGAWKRVSDLLRFGHLAETGQTRTASTGRRQRVLAITPEGREALAFVSRLEPLAITPRSEGGRTRS